MMNLNYAIKIYETNVTPRTIDPYLLVMIACIIYINNLLNLL